jgi:putative flippase GtrA
MKKFNWKQYGVYHLKWQMGIVITWPLMYLFIDILHWNYLCSMIAFQLVGAVVFYPIDRWILSKKEQAGQLQK